MWFMIVANMDRQEMKFWHKEAGIEIELNISGYICVNSIVY